MPKITTLGFVATATWLLFALLYGIKSPASFAALTPNELGDFLAGLFAPLVFLWLIIGHIQHSKELQTHAEAISNQQKLSLAILEIEQKKIAQLDSLAGEVALSGMRSRQ